MKCFICFSDRNITINAGKVCEIEFALYEF